MDDDVPPGEAAVFLGAATLDAVALVPALPGSDERLVADDLALAGGGPAATAAVACARLGLPAYFVGSVGDDPEGGLVRAGLEAEGVDTRGLQVARGTRTGASIVLVERAGGARAICTRPVPALRIAVGSTGARLLAAASWLHVDHLGWPALRQCPPGAAARVSLDAGNAVPGLDLSRLAVYAPTLAGLRRDLAPAGPDTPGLLAAALAAGAGAVVATCGGAGAVAAAADGPSIVVPGVHVDDLTSTLGAGDVFHGALVAALARGLALADACAYANAAAALSCRGLDGRSAIPDHATTARTAGSFADRTPGGLAAALGPATGSRP